jgi:hypothetical protein
MVDLVVDVIILYSFLEYLIRCCTCHAANILVFTQQKSLVFEYVQQEIGKYEKK